MPIDRAGSLPVPPAPCCAAGTGCPPLPLRAPLCVRLCRPNFHDDDDDDDGGGGGGGANAAGGGQRVPDERGGGAAGSRSARVRGRARHRWIRPRTGETRHELARSSCSCVRVCVYKRLLRSNY